MVLNYNCKHKCNNTIAKSVQLIAASNGNAHGGKDSVETVLEVSDAKMHEASGRCSRTKGGNEKPYEKQMPVF